MMFVGFVLVRDKLIKKKFFITRKDNIINIHILNKENISYKIPIYNKYNGVYYEPVIFPIEILIDDNNTIFFPYLPLMVNLENNELDFLNLLKNNILKKYNVIFNNDITKLNNFEKIIKTYSEYVINNNNKLDVFWKNIIIIRCYLLYYLSKNTDTSNYNNIYNKIKYMKYDIYNYMDDIKSIDEKIDYNFNIMYCNTTYYNFISLLGDDKIIDNKMYFVEYANNKIIPPAELLFYTFINNEFTNNIVRNVICKEHSNNIMIYDYYYNNKSLNNGLYISSIINNSIYSHKYEIDILKSKFCDTNYFYYITKKYSKNIDEVKNIINILINNYIFPLKLNKYNMNIIFDHLIFYSLYNSKYIINNKEILSLIPMKIKNLYINIIKILIELIDNKYDQLIYNKKFYTDHLHKNILNIFITNTSNDNMISVKYFRHKIQNNSLKNIKDKYDKLSKLILFTNIINWNNLQYNKKYFNIYYDNNELLYYKNKFNKIIINDYTDNRIKEIIYDPFKMFILLNNELEYVNWIKIIINKMNLIYINPISITLDDIYIIGKLFYLLFEIDIQCISDIKYLNFIKYCYDHKYFIINDNKINIKIKKIDLRTKVLLNLGTLMKDIINFK